MYPSAPKLPEDVPLSEPYTIEVPRYAALTPNSLRLKSTFWPTIYTPRKKYEPEPWSRGKVKWALEAMNTVVREAKAAQSNGEVGFLPSNFCRLS